jgi:hypothetical protein
MNCCLHKGKGIAEDRIDWLRKILMGFEQKLLGPIFEVRGDAV